MSECECNILSPVEIYKRDKLKNEKPYVYEKCLKYDEKVARGESIAILQFQYDYTCNLHCEHCCIKRFQEQGKQWKQEGTKVKCFTPESVAELGRQADELGLAHIVITGGEPMVFPDFDDVVKALDPQKFFITSDTNGWFFDHKRAEHVKKLGIDKVQVSLDSMDAEGHDEFRGKKGSWQRAVDACKAAKDVGLQVLVQTVVWKERVRSQEFEDFLKFLNGQEIPVFITYAKPVGAWEGKLDNLITMDDMDYVRGLEKKYNVFTHFTPGYGYNFGCIAVKRMVSITKYGDVMPCPYIHSSLGNFFEEPLKDILERGMKIKWFKNYYNTCLVAENHEFINTKLVPKIYGKSIPVRHEEVFGPEDYICNCKKDSSV